MDWGTVGLLHVYGTEVLPSSEYEVASISPDCDTLNETNYSPTLTVRTGIWGDVVAPFQEPSPATRSQPDISDVSGIVDKFRSAPTAPIVARSIMQPNIVDPAIPVGFSDISSCVDSFRGIAYPFAGPTNCP